MKWYTHLCEYYDVTPDQALELGTRSSGRKPDLPGSITCKPVSGKTFEDIWEEKDRTDTQSVFDFYKDQGAWSAFRQCVRHKDMENLHLTYIFNIIKLEMLKNKSHICEYGCGVAPFMTTLMKYIDLENQSNKDVKFKISLVDVDCEHFNFSKYRLQKIKKERQLDGITLSFNEVKAEKLPNFETKLDVVFCFEVLEHVPSPVKVIENITMSMNPGGIYIENFIRHENNDDDDDGPDLLTARNERAAYYNHLNENYNIIQPQIYDDNNPNITRIWQLKSN